MHNDVKAPAWSGSNALRHRDEVQQKQPGPNGPGIVGSCLLFLVLQLVAQHDIAKGQGVEQTAGLVGLAHNARRQRLAVIGGKQYNVNLIGHIGIACATTIAAFVSLLQYVIGLKKRGYWQFSRRLIGKVCRIVAVSLLTGAAVYAGKFAVSAFSPNWIYGSKWLLLADLSGLGILALAFFLISAKIFKVLDFNDIIRLIRRKK